MNLKTETYLAPLRRPNNPPLTGANIVSAPPNIGAWRVVFIHELTDDENEGNHNVYVDALDSTGLIRLGLYPRLGIESGWEGMRPDEETTLTHFEKPEPEPGANVPIFKDAKAWVEIADDDLSDRVTGLDARNGHTSYYVIFQWQEPAVIAPPVDDTVSVSRAELQKVQAMIARWLQ